MILELFWQCGIFFIVYPFSVSVSLWCLFICVYFVLSDDSMKTNINSSLVLLTTITMADDLAVRHKSITGAFGGFLLFVDTVTWMEYTYEEGVACPQGGDWSGKVVEVLAILWKAPRWWYEGLDMNHSLLFSFYVMDCILTIFTLK